MRYIEEAEEALAVRPGVVGTDLQREADSFEGTVESAQGIGRQTCAFPRSKSTFLGDFTRKFGDEFLGLGCFRHASATRRRFSKVPLTR